ncbi:O-antigen ligase [uncultured Algibacter sp.]|uniref:O-antigen ligase family protein n=1 Tax=uncultured Algibacter sp. TaxID=298659 RepID=UPI002639E9EC|nr:O-antigen ligase family protein [uncultured Algibacter sp.]
MLKGFKVSDIFLDKATNALIVLYATVLPLGFAIANITLGLMFAFFIFYIIIKKPSSKNLIQDINWIILFSVLFLIYALSLFYSENMDVGLNQVYRKSPMLLLTIFVFILRRKIKKNTIFSAMKMYGYSVTFVCITSIILAVYNCYDYKPDILLHCASDQNLASVFISYHKLYLSLYVTIAIFFVVYSVFYGSSKFKLFSINSIQLLVLFITLVLLGGRNSLLVSTLIVIGIPSFYWLKNKKIKNFVFFSSTILILVITSVYFNPKLLEKTKEAFNFGNQYSISKKWGGVAVRKIIWENSYNTFKKNLIIGVGAGDVQDELNKSYEIHAETNALNQGTYNAHNDILQIAITTGVLGIFTYLFSLIYIFYISFNKQNYIHCIFVILFFISGLTESLLERDMGIRVYSFFTILLFIFNTQINENSSNTQ